VLFTTAKALATGGVTLADLQPTREGLFDVEAVRIANLIAWEVDESLGRSGIVEVTLASGEERTTRVDHAPGHREAPLTDEQRTAKFLACAAHAGTAIPDASLREVVDLVGHLEDVEDVRVLARLLSGER
jgi:2-methylcitrate dehydratase PrpD